MSPSSVSVSYIVGQRALKQSTGHAADANSNYKLSDLRSWFRAYGHPSDQVPSSNSNIKMSAWADYNISAPMVYAQCYPENGNSTYKNSGNGQFRFRVRGFRDSEGGLASATMAGVHDNYSSSVNNITDSTWGTFTKLGSTSNNTVGYHYDVTITFTRKNGTTAPAATQRLQMPNTHVTGDDRKGIAYYGNSGSDPRYFKWGTSTDSSASWSSTMYIPWPPGSEVPGGYTQG